MSLEAILQENTKAVQENTALLKKMLELTQEVAPAAALAPSEPKVETKKTDSKKAEAPKTKVDAPAPEPKVKAETKTEPAEVAKPAPTKEDLGALVMSIVQSVSRQAAVDLLAEFGVKKAGELSEDQYAEFADRANNILLGA